MSSSSNSTLTIVSAYLISHEASGADDDRNQAVEKSITSHRNMMGSMISPKLEPLFLFSMDIDCNKQKGIASLSFSMISAPAEC